MWCDDKSPFRVNDLPHRSHICGRSPVWMRIWSLRFWRCENCFGHISQWNCLIPEWMCMCLLRWSRFLKRLSQTLQVNGFSPVWIRRCNRMSPLQANAFWHTSHEYGFSPVCRRKWTTSVCFFRNIIAQQSHWNVLSASVLVWLRKWLVMRCFNANDFWQISHLYGRLLECATIWCLLSDAECRYALEHSLHWWRRSVAGCLSSEWTFMCLLTPYLWLKAWPQRSQLYARSALCAIIWCRQLFRLVNVLSLHIEHLYGFSRQSDFMCASKSNKFSNVYLQ